MNHAIDRVIVVPMSGYINRFQAMASSAILARQLDAELHVCWEPQPVAPSPADEIFSQPFIDQFIISTGEARAEIGTDHAALPRYLTMNPGQIVLAGHDRGEQRFMPELREAIAGLSSPHTLVIIAGGKFFMHESGAPEAEWQPRFRRLRQEFYASVGFNPAISGPVESESSAHLPYLGLHLRYTDRAHQAPTSRSIRAALRRIAEASGLQSLFIASDTPGARDRWLLEAQGLGLQPWVVEHAGLDRSRAGSGHPALIDWQLLARSERSVYFAESSFAVEAAVAAGSIDRSIGLAADPIRSALVRVSGFGQALTSYAGRRARTN